MRFREATLNDISQIQIVRNSVNENVLSNPSLITDGNYIAYLTVRGKGWVCEINDKIVGFSVADLKENNIWALFVLPGYENRGVGRQLHDLMLNWYFDQTNENVWLSTSPGTRAAEFYKRSGWQVTGTYGKGEIKFEMSETRWRDRKKSTTF